MKKLFSFLMITMLMFVMIEVLHTEDTSMTDQELIYRFPTDAIASLNEKDDAAPDTSTSNDATRMDSTTLLLLASGLIGLAGFGRKSMK